MLYLLSLPADMSFGLDHSLGVGSVWKLVGARSKSIRAAAACVLTLTSLPLIGQDDGKFSRCLC